MTRTTEAFEDVIEQLVGALSHAGQALGNAAVAVKLMSSAETEVHEVRGGVEKPPYLVVTRVRQCVRRHAGKPSYDYGVVCQLRRHDNNQWLWTSRAYAHSDTAERHARDTAERYGWKIVAEAADSVHLAPDALEDGLPEEPQAVEEPKEAAYRLEKALGLIDDAIWPENFEAPNSPNANLLELVRKHEQLLAFVVDQMGKAVNPRMRWIFGVLVRQYAKLGFPEDIKAMTLRHLDTREAFVELEKENTEE